MNKPWSDWDLQQWLTCMGNRNVQEIQLGLTRIQSVAQKLNVHIPGCKVITVAGTNGKGSTVTALETIYHTAGYKVGSYTSPHLIHFNERIRVNLNPINDRDLCLSFCDIEEAREHVNLTYFEMTTLAALLHFKKQKLDILILEVGLGGRLDATNIVDADLSIITTIDFDHQDYLGSTLEDIGQEKAGILRKEKIFIYADHNPPMSIIKTAEILNCSSYYYDSDFNFQEHENHWDYSLLGKSINALSKPKIQLKSTSAAITACLLLDKHLPVGMQSIYSAMNSIFIPGRLQLEQGSISIMYDVSHNPQSVRLLADKIKQLDVRGQIHAVFSALKDKDILGLIFPLKHCVELWYPAQLDNNRAASADYLLSQFRDAEILQNICYNNPLIAFEEALNQAKAGDLIIVYGSFFTVSHVMAAQQISWSRRSINETSNG